jgi:polyisoprenoid-binding protein YceI
VGGAIASPASGSAQYAYDDANPGSTAESASDTDYPEYPDSDVIASPAAESTPDPDGDEVAVGVIGDPVDTTSCADEAPEGAAATYTIDPESSAARWRAQQELVGIGHDEPVGETNAILGTLYLDESGMPVACSRVDVDLRTLDSGEALRDNYLHDNTLESETYPLATFIVTGESGLDGGLPDGEEVTFRLLGNLDVYGQKREVAWEVTAIRIGDEITGSATTNFDMPDFDIERPTVGLVLSLDENVTLEIDVTATLAP